MSIRFRIAAIALPATRWLVAAALVVACSNTRSDPDKSTPDKIGEAAPIDPVLLIMGTAGDGKRGLFAVAPNGGEPRSVAAADALEPLRAVVSRSGTAIAMVVSNAGGKGRLYRGKLGRKLKLEVVQLDAPLAIVRAVSDDGQTIAVESQTSLVTLVGDDVRAIALSDRLMYGVQISADGSKLAYSTMKRDCAGDIERMGQCPVALFGVDLRRGGEPRKLAGNGKSVAYDPWFRDATGSELLYMTNAADDSDRCNNHVNDCEFQIRSMAWSGENDRVALESGVLAREAPDGTIAHRAIGRSWLSQSLVVGGRAIEGTVSHPIHHWSPNSRWIAIERRHDRDVFLDIIDVKGKPTRDGLPGGAPVIVGWSAGPVATGTRTLAEPDSVRKLRRSVQLALSRGGANATLAVMKGRSYARDRVRPDAHVLEGSLEAKNWLAANDAGLIITPVFDYCLMRKQVPSLRSLVAIDSDHVVVRRDDQPPVRTSRGEPVAKFPIPDGPTIELLGIEFPKTAIMGSRIPVQLSWRAEAPPGPGWKVLMHFDSAGLRFQADHEPPLCKQDWQGSTATYEIDVEVSQSHGLLPAGTYDVYVGWFKGAARAGDRVKVGSIEITK